MLHTYIVTAFDVACITKSGTSTIVLARRVGYPLLVDTTPYHQLTTSCRSSKEPGYLATYRETTGMARGDGAG